MIFIFHGFSHGLPHVNPLSFPTWVALGACSVLKVDLQLKIQHKVQHVYVVTGNDTVDGQNPAPPGMVKTP